ncbi:unnamed protein product [Didymodactylos carnosus]|uniref:Protein FAM98A n=1 Tax=Didymodactylos carnosus TaxID=1234261 RepID=A0A815HDY5_9BILA|nr:unnamed protein product [Didymodactylos carnosus]CAF4225194.1 unnamed protein product [Didymodactylos carnosus]
MCLMGTENRLIDKIMAQAGILDSLTDLGSPNEIKDEERLEQVLAADIKSEQFLPYAKLIAWLTQELNGFYNIGEYVQNVNSPQDINNFLMELGGFLNDYGCPYTNLQSQNNQKLTDHESRVQLLDFLCTELQAAKMVKLLKPEMLTSGVSQENTKKMSNESDEARDLKALLIALGFPAPPPTITGGQICTKVEQKVTELLKSLPPNYLGKPLLKVNLSEKQWSEVHKIHSLLYEDYKTRREVLLKRLDVTIQSFKWADRLKNKNNEITEAFSSKRKQMVIEPNVRIEDILAAREDLCHMEKTCGTKELASIRSNLHKIIIPEVPDRGGRTTELQAPPPDMPTFQRGGGHQGHRGGQQHNAPRQQHNDRPQSGRVQGGWAHGGGGGGYGDMQYTGGYQQQQMYAPAYQHQQVYQNPNMSYQGQQQVINEYAGGMNQGGYQDNSGYGGGRGRGSGRGRGRGRGRGGGY